MRPTGCRSRPSGSSTPRRLPGDAADEIGYPVVAKLNGDAIAHKTERGLVKLRLGDRAAVEAAAADLLAAATPDDGDVDVLDRADGVRQSQN